MKHVATLPPLAALLFAFAPGASAQAVYGRTDRELRPGVDEAEAFMARAEARLEELSLRTARAAWVAANFITVDTEALAADAQTEYSLAVQSLAMEARRFDGMELPPRLARKFKLLKLGLSAPPPSDPEKAAKLTSLTVGMKSDYGSGKYCLKGARDAPGASDERCLGITALGKRMARSRDPRELLEIWQGWRTVSPPMRERYRRFVELSNEGARELGFEDTGAMWRSRYDLSPEEFAAEVERLWQQVKPLYVSLHSYVRRRLGEAYGTDLVPQDGMIPAHLLGNMWAQDWTGIYDLVAPPGDEATYELTDLLRARGIDPREMVRYGEGFFTSLGFEPLPETFWERSLFVKPRDRDVICHASAWDIDDRDDIRIKMCIEVDGEDFSTIHHELGHNFYQRAYKEQPYLFRGGANGGFHEAIGDAVALSITPEYLRRIGLLDRVPGPESDVGLLLRRALDKVAFLPFGLLIDKWRWQVFSGEVRPEDYNRAWWALRDRYQGVAAPVERTEEHFDPGAKYHIPANVSYTRYFIAHILQFQFHRALCRAAGYEGPLHRCSIYGSREAGGKLKAMLELGQSLPWPDALFAMTGEREMDATAILDYFAPLKRWLDEQNRGQVEGWKVETADR
ncbi:MAG: M2 family metallopeptidase [Gemmatimonadota bacterium]